jgi:hypothetical protein
MTAAVTEGGRYRRPLQKAGGGDISGRYMKWPLQEAVTGSDRYGTGGRYRKRAAAMAAAVT